MADRAETIDDSGRRIGGHAWCEMRLFEILGRWSGTVREPRAQALLARQSRHHAWHAELWHDLLPALPHLPAADLVAPGEAATRIVALLTAIDDPAGRAGAADSAADAAAVAKLAALYEEALPQLAATYADHLDRTTVVTDGPTIRALRLVLADLADDGAAGADLLAALRSTAAG
ncbi:MAG TPA: hypothetical protein VF015_10890 [Acidimicrobiales bacterium]